MTSKKIKERDTTQGKINAKERIFGALFLLWRDLQVALCVGIVYNQCIPKKKEV